MDKGRLVVMVSSEIYHRLVELADQEERTPNQQAAWLLRERLEQVDSPDQVELSV